VPLITKENRAWFRAKAEEAKARLKIERVKQAAQVQDFIGSCPASWLSALDRQQVMLQSMLERELSGQGPPNGRAGRIHELLQCQTLLIVQRQKLTGQAPASPAPSTAKRSAQVRPLGASAPAPAVGARLEADPPPQPVPDLD